ncbi:MAG: peptidylprolyl isomerase [Halieaceae bacterium]|jgi:FKBP-type peptidyl-prolyl cis-trans isomerase SlyD|nr:peptidylprolyl isomerase [Halieaceae bacterium]
MQIEANKVVSIDYTLKNDAGDVLDQSTPENPLAYLHGHNNLIPGLENALAGKAAGDDITASIPPAEAYGAYDENLIQAVPKNLFQGVDQVEPGMQFQAQTGQGMQVVTVREVDDENVTIDANHALAGQTLHFDVTIKDVREASEEELAHGHVHGPGGHEH